MRRCPTALLGICVALALGAPAVADEGAPAADAAAAPASAAHSSTVTAAPAEHAAPAPEHPSTATPEHPPTATPAQIASPSTPPPAAARTPAPAPSPAPSGAAAGPHVEAAVQIGERRLFAIRAPRAGASPEQRARQASQLLEQIVAEGQPQPVRVARDGATAVVYVGATPVIQLSDDDATLAGDASLTVHAEQCASAIREGLRIELRRRAVANVVFSLSVVVLSGVLSFLLLGGVSRGARRIADLVEARADLRGWRLGSIEVLTPAALRVAVSTAISIAKPIVQFAILLGWLLFALSLVPATASLGGRLTGFLLAPATAFFARIGAALPVLVVVLIGGFALAMLLRFLRVFFDSVAQGGIHLRWLPRDKARPASLVAQVATVVCALLAAAPLVSPETEWSTLRIGGFAVTVAVVLAATPALANVAAGTLLLFGGRLEPGAFVEIGSCAGRLVELTLTELRVQDRTGAEIRVPHLVTLFRPLKLFGAVPPSIYEITVDARAQQGKIRKALADAVKRQGRTSHLELVEITGDVARYRVVGAAAPGEDDLASAIADALTREGLAFGRIRKLDVE